MPNSYPIKDKTYSYSNSGDGKSLFVYKGKSIKEGLHLFMPIVNADKGGILLTIEQFRTHMKEK